MTPSRQGKRAGFAVLLAALSLAGSAEAQRSPALGGLPDLATDAVGRVAGDVRGDLGQVTQGLDGEVRDLASARLDGLQALVRANPRALELDAHGQAVVRGQVLAVDPSPEALDRAIKAGFGVLRRTTLDPLGLQVVTLSPPPGMAARDGLRRLRRLDPGGQYDLDHLYSPSGAPPAPTGVAATETAAPPASAAVGLLDTGVDAAHPALAGDVVAQKAFAPGGVAPAAHGTAVASLIAGRGEGMRGAAPGARLYAADVYGSGPTGGSADAILGALAWMAETRVRVVNISLVGPANLTVQAAVRALLARGVLIVAPVGNDGPAAPPLYPASYPGVIAVTAVDARGRVLPEAGHALHVDFAAPGADVLAARPGGGLVKLRGTSFAAPIVSGELAVLTASAGGGAGANAVARLVASARPARGDRWLGHGVVGDDLALAGSGPR